MKGRKPKPTKLKAQAGNPGKRPLNEAEPVYEAGAGQPPEMLDAVAVAEWNRVSSLLTASGVLTQADRLVLVVYCGAWSEWVAATALVKKHGMVMKSAGGGAYQNPYLGIRNRAADTMAKLGASLGLDPSSRSRLTAAVPAKAKVGLPKTRPETHLDRLGAQG